MKTTSFGIRKFVMALAIAAAAAGTMAGPALAADWDHHREPIRHDEDRHWRAAPHRVFYAPAPVFERIAPAPVYVPPPVAYAPAASFSVTIPLNFQ
ncbi:MAG TPA: hypothetical protein VFA22_07845 [Stellaceae bacterium]|nr:hypothetical protein [Stellaceae bacterium]